MICAEKNYLSFDRWLDVAVSLLSPEEFEQTKQAVEDFKRNEGPQLQEYLQKRYREKINWLSDYWLSVAYLSSRSPIASKKYSLVASKKYLLLEHCQ